MHLVFVGAHPDDETFASGTIAKHVKMGHKATIVLATRGERGHFKMSMEELRRTRTNEMEEAAKVLGASVRFLDFEDAEVPSNGELKTVLVDVVREIKPDVVMTFHPGNWRDDHRNVGLSTVDACFRASLPLVKTHYHYHHPVPDIYFVELWGMIPLQPDVCIDISDVFDLKIKALKKHKSQVVEWLPWHDRAAPSIEEIIERTARQLGAECGVMYAEAFKALRTPGKKALQFFPSRV